ncbi:MAG TPA: hypothetical protein VGP17_02120 [Solirubrobacteraceae bacterium]|jgi:hypothetical protein|nr:hypothetical protein [Solirubrobacteraceae bacterium]
MSKRCRPRLWPVLLSRTPYEKNTTAAEWTDPAQAAAQNFIVVQHDAERG